MKKTAVIVMAVALAATMAAAPVGTAEEPEVVVVFDTPDGVVTLTQNEIDQSCGGQAAGLAGDFYCNNGDHVRVASFFGHGCSPSGYTGTLESVLKHDGGERYFQCSYQDGSLVGTNSFGTWPSMGQEFRHDCWSYEVGTENTLATPNGLGTVLTGGESETDPNGIPGGTGGWSCVLLN